ncbi:CaiB/BaiF CoA transferase family protein [Bacilliculturomica massiliensis]|uniref:CaiB/BaiF CoA transferase family protein n=1 Tax=Bacilliculturomica massiliensis TaxID=1917867 RepID=UPI00102F7C52|nr:CoA transferase [Bacilliculturomica massiliensis]
MKPLSGVTVLDFTQAFSGPYCTLNLADYGARVIKVERTGTGDQTREWMPLAENGGSAYFALYNRNKEGIAVDLSKEEGKELIRRLVKKADIVVNNFKVGTMDKLGIGYEELKKIKPDLVFASVTGYGQTGPLAKLAAYDNIIEATCGLMGQSGFPDRQPVRSGCSIGDSYTGLMAAFGIAAAYYHKLMTGEGQTVDVAMQDSLFASIEDAILEYGVSGTVMERSGNSRSHMVAPYDVIQCKDGWYTVAAVTEKGWAEFCREADMPELLEDPRFQDNELRCRHNAELIGAMEPFFRDKTMEELKAIFSCENFAAAPVIDAGQTMREPHMLQRDMVVEIDDPNVGKYKAVGIPIKFEKTPAEVVKASPLLGEDTMGILMEIGYTEEEVRTLAAAGVVELAEGGDCGR